MVNPKDLRPGMQVVIVSDGSAKFRLSTVPDLNNSGKIDQWLGQVMTIKDVVQGKFSIRWVRMAEDPIGFWHPRLIDRIYDELEDFDCQEDLSELYNGINERSVWLGSD